MPLQLPNLIRLKIYPTHYLWAAIFIITLLVMYAGWVPVLDYDRRAISEGQFWLGLTGNLTHFNWTHWLLNMSGLAIIAYFFSHYATLLHWFSVTLISSLFVGAGLYWFNPELSTYVGLSGTLHGLFIYSAYREIRHYPLSGYGLMLVLVAKLLWEVFVGPVPGSEKYTEIRVATDAHLYGGIGGFVTIAGFYLVNKLVEIEDGQ